MLVENVQQSVCVICKKMYDMCKHDHILYKYIYIIYIYNHVDIRYTHDFCCLPFSVSVTHASALDQGAMDLVAAWKSLNPESI